MTVRVKFFSRLKDVATAAEIDQPMPDGATAAALLAALCERFPELEKWDRCILIGAGVEWVGRDYVLREGDAISIMPPVQGG